MRRRRSSRDTSLLAGWLFADLLLGFAVIVLGSTRGGLPASSAGSTTTSSVIEATTTTTTTTTTPTSSTPPRPPGVDLQPLRVEAAADFGLLTGPPSPERDAEVLRVVTDVQNQVSAAGMAGKRVALLITFGVHPTTGEGQRVADAFNQGLRDLLPDSFGGAVPRSFDYYSNQGIGTLRSEIYFFTD